MNQDRTTERRELLGIFEQLRAALLATFKPEQRGLALITSFHPADVQWEEVRPTAEALGLHMERGGEFFATFAGTRVRFLIHTIGCIDAMCTTIRDAFKPAPQGATFDPQAPRRTIGNFSTRATADRTIADAQHNLSEAKKSGNLALIGVMADALRQAEKLARWVRDPEPELSTSQLVAIELCREVRERLRPVELEAVTQWNRVRRARGTIGHRCRSEVYMNTIEALDRAWETVTGQLCDLDNSDQAQQFDDAFTLARDADYDPAHVPLQVQAA